jgi:hypothetical protein
MPQIQLNYDRLHNNFMIGNVTQKCLDATICPMHSTKEILFVLLITPQSRLRKMSHRVINIHFWEEEFLWILVMWTLTKYSHWANKLPVVQLIPVSRTQGAQGPMNTSSGAYCTTLSASWSDGRALGYPCAPKPVVQVRRSQLESPRNGGPGGFRRSTLTSMGWASHHISYG